MTLSLGTRPRSEAERKRMGEVVAEAPARVGLRFADDGWTAASLWVGGHVPVWLAPGSSEAADAVLAKLGLPPTARGEAEAELSANLGWVVPPAAPGRAALPPAEGPLVTILTCTYNRAKLIRESLASALAQTWPREVLVVDDGSTDGTAEVLAGIEGIRVLRQPKNQGKPAALARGVAEARGEAILVLDDDDLLEPGALQVLATALFREPELVAVWADTVTFRSDTGQVSKVQAALRLPVAMIPRAVLHLVPAMPGATLVRAAAWRALGPLDPRLIRGQDVDLFLALSRSGPIEAIPLTTFRYRLHDGARGAAGDQWKGQDWGTHRVKFLRCVKPVFLDRWRALGRGTPRDESHSWALGLFLRDLVPEARRELRRWKAPFTPSEAWMRSRIGVATEAAEPEGTLLVVDDGDEGALEETLYRHARGPEALYVDLSSSRDPLAGVRLFWEGTYGARENPIGWVDRPGPWRVAWTSAPDWTPPGLLDPGLLEPVSGPETMLLACATFGWPVPSRPRAGHPLRPGPLVRSALAAREALDAGRPGPALGALLPVLQNLPGWRGGWLLAALAMDGLGEAAEAARCRARVSPIPAGLREAPQIRPL